MIGFVALAVNVGLEAILGAFIAGAVLNFVDRDTMSHPQFRVKLDVITYGFVIPVFFVASGMMLDLEGLFSSPAAVARIPVFLLALLVVRGVPALMFRSSIGTRRSIAAGLLLATSLPFLVTAADIGVTIGARQARHRRRVDLGRLAVRRDLPGAGTRTVAQRLGRGSRTTCNASRAGRTVPA